MVDLTPSREVAVFLDDDQFGPGQSVDKCGPEAVATFYYSVEVGKNNMSHSGDIHAMAHTDYLKYIGPDNPADHKGTSDTILYTMLTAHGFHWKEGPKDIAWVKAWLALGYPVILGIVESSVHDIALQGNPYNWDTAGFTHVILATGAGAAGEILVRDTANIGPGGVRPGPRKYDTGKLQLVSATMAVPSWLPNPPSNNPPAPTFPPEPTEVDYKKQLATALASAQEALAHWPT